MKEVKFNLYERRNCHRKSKKEWALGVSIDNNDLWTISSWEKKPKDKFVKEIKEIFIRSCEIYHKSFRFPIFELQRKEES